MIGNDIIDFEKAKKESNWRRKGYLQKVYSHAEQKMILSHPNPDVVIWVLWSIKEAAYKASQRMTFLKEYAPLKVSCNIDSNIENSVYYGNAYYNNQQYYTQTQVFDDYIHTIALHHPSNFGNIRKIYIGKYPGENYMEFLRENEYLAYSEKIIKNKYDLPDLYDDGQVSFVSVSHHGEYLGIIATH